MSRRGEEKVEDYEEEEEESEEIGSSDSDDVSTSDDSVGSLVDFIADNDSIEYEESDGESKYDGLDISKVELLTSRVDENGLRRSTRTRVEPKRYVDPEYEKLMFEDVDVDEALRSTDGSSTSDYDSDEK